ncbi:pectin lyase-like protein [Serendipita vermifera]|nr:pectin lyase-like protein [Serendipita vermifera]
MKVWSLLTSLVLLGVNLANAGSSSSNNNCVVPHTNGVDDTPAIMEVVNRCSVNSTITFSKGVKYNTWSPMTWNLTNVNINHLGSWHLPENVTEVQSKTASSAPWFLIQGTNVNLAGGYTQDSGAIYGYGNHWWDNGILDNRPYMVTFNVNGGTISRMKVIKPIAHGFRIPGKNIVIKDHYVDAMPSNGTRDTAASFPFNTDGFNIGGQNITLDGYWGKNGDDCVSIINGAKNIVARNGYCGFSSHGLSIGSLGSNGQDSRVSNILFENWVMDGAVYGARFKSWTGGNGLAANITWRNMVLLNVSTPIFITQNYYDQNKGPRPNNTAGTSTHIENFKFENFEGYLNPSWTDGTCISDPCWNYVEGIDNTKGIIFDLYNGTATNLQVKNLHVKPYKKSYSDTTVICDPATLAPDNLEDENLTGLWNSRLSYTGDPLSFLNYNLGN